MEQELTRDQVDARYTWDLTRIFEGDEAWEAAFAEVKAQAVRCSRRRVFVGLHTKFGAVSFCRFAEVADFEAIVTDTGLTSAEAQRYSLLGPQVIRV